MKKKMGLELSDCLSTFVALGVLGSDFCIPPTMFYKNQIARGWVVGEVCVMDFCFETIIVVSHDTRNDIITVLCSREMKDTRPVHWHRGGGRLCRSLSEIRLKEASVNKDSISTGLVGMEMGMPESEVYLKRA